MPRRKPPTAELLPGFRHLVVWNRDGEMVWGCECERCRWECVVEDMPTHRRRCPMVVGKAVASEAYS